MAKEENPFAHYDDPERAKKIYGIYVTKPERLGVIARDLVSDAIQENSSCDDLDLALDKILRRRSVRIGCGSPHYIKDPDANGCWSNAIRFLSE